MQNMVSCQFKSEFAGVVFYAIIAILFHCLWVLLFLEIKLMEISMESARIFLSLIVT